MGGGGVQGDLLRNMLEFQCRGPILSCFHILSIIDREDTSAHSRFESACNL